MTKTTQEPFTVVFVDDESHSLTLFRHTFKEEIKSNKINLLTFDNPLECLKHLRDFPTNLSVMFSDINMPQMDGFDLYNEIKGIHPDVDMFFITAYDLDDYKNQATSLGAKGFLSKPVNYKAVKTILRDYFDA